MKNTNKIDVHHHIFPREYVEAIKKVGIENTLGVDFPDWTPDTSLKIMDKHGIKIAMLSITSPGVYFPGNGFPKDFAERLARMSNEIIADTKKKYYGRFGGFATIPLLNTERAVEELNYAMDDLLLDGVCLMTNYKGKYLGHNDFDSFFSELDKRKAVVYIHPSNPAEKLDTELDIPHALFEAPFDTTRAVANLIYTGTLDRYKNIKYILSHGGGVLPFLGWRIAMIEYAQQNKKPLVFRSLYDFLIKNEPVKGLQYLKNMYFDTALVAGEYAMKSLKLFAGQKHIVFGTDFCIAKIAPIVIKNLRKDGNFSDDEIKDIWYANCLGLFPSLKGFYNNS